jgi:hypothetical protein
MPQRKEIFFGGLSKAKNTLSTFCPLVMEKERRGPLLIGKGFKQTGPEAGVYFYQRRN